MKITDGKMTVTVEIMQWNGSGYNPDWSIDCLNAGSLEYIEDAEAYKVEDMQAAIDYLIEVAGEYEDMHVFVDDECVNN